jgi:hypothetical protein
MTWMFYENKILHVCGYWKTILFRWLQATTILFDYETGWVGNLTSLAFHASEEHPNWRSYTSCASIWSQGGLGLRVRLKVRLCNLELDWISTLPCAYSWLSSTLFISRMSCMIHSLISREWKKKGMHKHWDVSSGCDVEEEAEQCHL